MRLRVRRLAPVMLVLVAATVPGRAQVELRRILPLLEDVDRDEAREVAARYLVSLPDSPAIALRAWAGSGGWRRTSLLLRVLGERGELSRAELEAGFASRYWPVRAAAARAAGLLSFDSTARLVGLLDDEFFDVRREALFALARTSRSTEKACLKALADPRLQPLVPYVYLADPVAAGAKVLARLLADDEVAAAVLPRLAGRRLGKAAGQLLVDYSKTARSKPLRALAMRALPRTRWTSDPVSLILSVVDASGPHADAVDCFAGSLRRSERMKLLDGVFDEPDPKLRERRFQLAGQLSTEAGRDLLRMLRKRPELASDSILQALLANKRLHNRLVEVFLHMEPNTPARTAWVQQIGRLAKTDKRLVQPMLEMLSADPKTAYAAFRALVWAGVPDQRLVEFAFSDKVQLARRATALLVMSDKLPAEMWLRLLARPEKRLSWIGAKGCAGHVGEPAVRDKLTEAVDKLPDANPARGAALSSLLEGLDEQATRKLMRKLVGYNSRVLDRVAFRHLETTEKPFASRVLSSLEHTRYRQEALVTLSARGDTAAARSVLLAAGSYSSAQITRARRGILACLEPSDLGLLHTLLLGDGERGAAAPWLREHVVLWLTKRADLPAVDLLREAYAKNEAVELRAPLAAALARRGVTDQLDGIVDNWIRSGDIESEGVLLEVVDSLAGLEHVDDVQARFLVRLMILPALRDSLTAVRNEWQRKGSHHGRMSALYPLLAPTVKAVVSIDPERFRDLLVHELRALDRGTDRVPAWSAVNKAYLSRALMHGLTYVGGAKLLRPLLEWAMRVGPRPHDSDGVFLLLEARFAADEGRFAAAAGLARKGIRELTLTRVDDRSVEWIAREIVDSTTAMGWTSLTAWAGLLRARQLAANGDRAGALEQAELAAIAAREDPRLLARIGSFHRDVASAKNERR